MLITWNGHACFTITMKDGRKIVTDPFDASVGYKAPMIDCDIVTVSHAHHDHNCLEALKSYGKLLCTDEAFEEKGLKITACDSYHDDDFGSKRGKNLIFRIEAENKVIVHMGDIGHMPDEKQVEFMKNCDLLLIPIGGTYTIDTQAAIEVIKAVRPVCAVPMHYLTPLLSFPIEDEKAFAARTKAVYIGKSTEDIETMRGCMIFDY